MRLVPWPRSAPARRRKTTPVSKSVGVAPCLAEVLDGGSRFPRSDKAGMREFRAVDNETSEQAADAVMHPLGNIDLLGRAIEVEDAHFVPVLHDRETIEQRYLALQRDKSHRFRVAAQRDHR